MTVTPNLSTCSRNVTPSEDYSCPGLALGTQYTFTVSAINCGDQEGMGYTFTVQPQGKTSKLQCYCFTILHIRSTIIIIMRVNCGLYLLNLLYISLVQAFLYLLLKWYISMPPTTFHYFICSSNNNDVHSIVPQNLMNVEFETIYDSSSKLREVRVSWRNQVCSCNFILLPL